MTKPNKMTEKRDELSKIHFGPLVSLHEDTQMKIDSSSSFSFNQGWNACEAEYQPIIDELVKLCEDFIDSGLNWHASRVSYHQGELVKALTKYKEFTGDE